MKKNIGYRLRTLGKNLVRNFAELGFLAAVCDPDEELASLYAHQYGTVVCCGVRECSDRYDAVPAPLTAMGVEAMNWKARLR